MLCGLTALHGGSSIGLPPQPMAIKEGGAGDGVPRQSPLAGTASG